MLTSLLSYLHALARWRLSLYFAGTKPLMEESPQMDLEEDNSPLSKFLQEAQTTRMEITLLAIALVPHVHPHFFDDLMLEFMPQGGDFRPIGGARGTHFRGFLPTGETALFLLAGDDMEQRTQVQQLFTPDHFFNRKKILWLQDVEPGEPAMSGRIILSPEYIELFITGKCSALALD